MCKTTDEAASDEMVEVSLSDSKPTASPEETTTTTTSSSSSGFCCKSRRPVASAAELGVWEESLEDRANCVSRWMLGYLTPVLKLGAQKVLDADDMGVPSKEDRADRAYDLALQEWEKQSAKCRRNNEKKQKAYEAKLAKCTTEAQRAKIKPPQMQEPSIALSLVKAFGIWQLLVGIFYYIIGALLNFVPVMILNDLVKYFESGLSINEYNGFAHPWVEVAALAVVPVLITLLQTRHQVIMAHCAIFVRTAVSTMLYRKALRVSAAARAQTSTGQVVNMMSNDTAQLQRFLQFVGMTMVAPIQIVLALVLIYQQVRMMTACRYLQCIHGTSHSHCVLLRSSRLVTRLGWELALWLPSCR